MAMETQGTRFYWSTSTALSTSTTAAVAGVNGISGPQSQGSEIDITDFDSTAKEFLMGLKDEGTLSLELFRDTSNAGQTNMIADQNTRAARAWTIDFSTRVIEASAIGSRLTGLGYVQGWSYSLGADDAVKVSGTVRITGIVNTTKQTS